MKAITLSTSIVQAILNGRKMQLRRAINKDISNQFDIENDGKTVVAYINPETGDSCKPEYAAPYRPGDTIYVRETWAKVNGADYGTDDFYAYKASNEWQPGQFAEHFIDRWRSPVSMPREAARIFLKVTDVRCESTEGIWVWVYTFEMVEVQGCE